MSKSFAGGNFVAFGPIYIYSKYGQQCSNSGAETARTALGSHCRLSYLGLFINIM